MAQEQKPDEKAQVASVPLFNRDQIEKRLASYKPIFNGHSNDKGKEHKLLFNGGGEATGNANPASWISIKAGKKKENGPSIDFAYKSDDEK